MSVRTQLVASLIAAAWALSMGQAGAPQPPANVAPPAVSEAPPIEGDLRAARKQLQELAEGARHEDASRFAAGVLAAPNFASFAESERAEFLFDVGVACGAAQSYEDAAEASHAARGLAGSSALGLDSAYNAGAFRLQRAELLRREIPEVRERLQLPPLPQHPPQNSQQSPPPASPPGGAPSGAQPPDPLQVAREAYRLARADLVERWRADPTHRDTRANLELVQRRLRELDELEREREQQQQDENEQQDPNQKNDSDPQQNPEGEQQEPQDDPQQQDPQQPEQDPQQQKPEEPEQDPSKDPQQQPEPQEQQGEEEPPQPDPAQPQEERLMTPEEIQRLLQQLEQIDEQAQQVQAALRRARRTPVKNDW